MNTGFKYIIGLLVLTALILGYKVQQKSAPSTSKAPIVKNQVVATDVFAHPTASSSPAEISAHFKLIQDKAVVTDKLDLTACKPSPEVISLKEGSNLTLVNTDTVEHALVFNKDQFFIVSGNSTKAIKAAFGKGAGLYGYGCDKSKTSVGLILVTK